MISDIHEVIDKEVKANDVVLFMKGTPEAPMCGFSGRVVQILDHLGAGFKGINVLEAASCARASRNMPTGRPSRSSM